jgi:hypothetical protein
MKYKNGETPKVGDEVKIGKHTASVVGISGKNLQINKHGGPSSLFVAPEECELIPPAA